MTTTNQKYVQSQVFQLAGAGVSQGDNSMTLETFTQIDGTPLTMSKFGIIGYGTVEPASGKNEEQISFTGVVANVDGTTTLTGIHTVLDIFPYTGTANFAQDHAGGVAFVISNTAGFYGNFANIINDESISGKWTFLTAERPTLTVDADSATLSDLVTVGQLNRTAIAGSPNASTVIQGLVQLATQAQYDAKTLTGSTGAKLVATPDLNRAVLYHDWVTGTGTSTAYVITPSPAVSVNTVGDEYTWTAPAANTTTTPTLKVGGATALTIINADGTPLKIGQIPLNGVVKVVNYGGNFQLVSVGTIVVPEMQVVQTVPWSATSVLNNTLTKIADITSLTGDIDDVYTLNLEMENTSGGTASAVHMTFNNDTGSHYYVQSFGGSISSVATDFAIMAGANCTTYYALIQIKASKTIAGTTRVILVNGTAFNIGAPALVNQSTSGGWTDTTTQITSIQIYTIQNSGSTQTSTGTVTISKINR